MAQAGATGAGCLVAAYGLALAALLALSVLLVVIFVVAVL